MTLEGDPCVGGGDLRHSRSVCFTSEAEVGVPSREVGPGQGTGLDLRAGEGGGKEEMKGQRQNTPGTLRAQCVQMGR